MTRVLIIDDHPIVLQGCRRILSDLGIADIVEPTASPWVIGEPFGCDPRSSSPT